MPELIVEDGTNVEDANTVVDMDFIDEYHEARGNTAWEEGDDDAKAGAIIRANEYIFGRYSGQWAGERTYGRLQTLPWPRLYATDVDGEEIADDEIPIELKKAIAEAALRELASPGSLTPDQITTQQIKRIKEKVGPLETETEYADAKGETTRPEVTLIDELLAALLVLPSSTRVGWLKRA